MITLDELRIRTKIPDAALAPWESSTFQSWEKWAEPYLKKVYAAGKVYYTPDKFLDKVLKLIAHELNYIYVPIDEVMGFIRGRSTQLAARRHVGAREALAVDLRRFFTQIKLDRIRDSLAGEFSPEAIEMILGIATVHGTLPMGLRTSPVLSNICFEETDRELSFFSKANDIVYTRWADDLIFSGDTVDDDVYSSVKGILSENGWILNSRKTRFMRNQRMILGRNVHKDLDRPHVPRSMKRDIRLQLYLFQEYGKSYLAHPNSWAFEKLAGRIEYVRSIDQTLGLRFRAELDSILETL